MARLISVTSGDMLFFGFANMPMPDGTKRDYICHGNREDIPSLMAEKLRQWKADQSANKCILKPEKSHVL